ncbi:MAG: glutathione synthase [Thermodesulfobacteriota bacterium]
MVLSFHPMVVAHRNLICAGRDPGEDELAEIRKASAVILPQGCRESLFRMARDNARHVFPDYTARFAFPGKTGQARLFEKYGVRAPKTLAFGSLCELPGDPAGVVQDHGMGFPLVFKLDWGGESDTVRPIENAEDLRIALAHAKDCEATGQKGFVLQEYIDCGGRSLRVVKVGSRVSSYFRVASRENPFYSALSKGAAADRDAEPEKQENGRAAATALCSRACIDLAGLDLLFSGDDPEPYFLEINYFFGRKGLGGSENFYETLLAAVDGWLAERGLSRKNG